MSSSLIAATLGALGIVSAWALAAWKVRPFRRDTLLDYLKVANELEGSHKEHAQWLRDFVALRVQAHALSDLRPRINGRLLALSGIGALISYAAIFTPGTPRVVVYGAIALLLGSFVMTWRASNPRYQVPGGAQHKLDGKDQEAASALGTATKQLVLRAKKLPTSPLPAPAND